MVFANSIAQAQVLRADGRGVISAGAEVGAKGTCAVQIPTHVNELNSLESVLVTRAIRIGGMEKSGPAGEKFGAPDVDVVPVWLQSLDDADSLVFGHISVPEDGLILGYGQFAPSVIRRLLGLLATATATAER